MSTILGSPLSIGGGGGNKLNIAYGLTPPTDTSKLWVRMQGEPYSVESTDDIAIQSGEFTEYMGYSDISSLVGHVVSNSPTGVVCNGKIFIAGDEKWNVFHAIDLETKMVSLNYVTVASPYASFPALAVKDNKFYIIGGRPSNSQSQSFVNIFDTDTNMMTKQNYAGKGGNSSSASIRGAVALYGSKFYIFGSSYETRDINRVYTFDTEDYSSENLMFTPTTSNFLRGAGGTTQILPVIGDFAYYIDKATTSGAATGGIKIDLKNRQFYSYKTKLVYSHLSTVNFEFALTTQIQNKIYFCLFNDSSKHYVTIFEVQFSDNECTITHLQDFFSLNTPIRGAMGTTNGSLFLWVQPTGSLSYQNNAKVYKMPYRYPLENGKLLLQEGSKSFRIINSKDAKISFKIKDTFLGKETGYADEVDAYLYNTAKQKWISLDGTPYTT